MRDSGPGLLRKKVYAIAEILQPVGAVPCTAKMSSKVLKGPGPGTGVMAMLMALSFMCAHSISLRSFGLRGTEAFHSTRL